MICWVLMVFSCMDRISIQSDQLEFFSLSRLLSGPCAVPHPPIIQRHGVGSSESLWARLQPPELHLRDLNQERDLGRLLHSVRLSPMQLACCHGNHRLPVGSGKYDIGHRLSGVYKGSEHWDQHYWHHGHAGKLLLWVCLTLLWLAQCFSWCKSQIVHFLCFFVVSSWVLNRWKRCLLKPPNGWWTGRLLWLN